MYQLERALQKQLILIFIIIFNKILNTDFTVGDSINLRDWIKIRINKTEEKAKAIYYKNTQKKSLQLLEMIDYFFFNRPQRSVDLNDFGKRQHVKSEAENPPRRMSRQRVLNLTPKSTELQLSRPCHVVMPGERQVSSRRSPQAPRQGWALSTWGNAAEIDTLCKRCCIGVGFFKESVTFCLSFQVDLTSTSAAAAKAEAAANFLIHRSQNTYRRDLYRYTTVQGEELQPWDGRGGDRMESRRPSPLPSQHPHLHHCTFSEGAH